MSTEIKLCKRLAGPIIPLSWSCLVCKRVSHVDVITGGQSTTIFLWIRHFRHGDGQTNNHVIQEQDQDQDQEKADFCKNMKDNNLKDKT